MDEFVIRLLKDRPLVLPRIILNNYRILGITDTELIIIMLIISIGDKVVYPMYGAGVIEAIEDKLVDGIKTAFYVLKISVCNLKISISVNKAEEKGIRNIQAPAEVLDIIKKTDTIDMPDNWTHAIASVTRTQSLREACSCSRKARD